MITIRSWLDDATARLSGSQSARLDAGVLLAFVTGKNRSWLRAFDETSLEETHLDVLEGLLMRRIKGEPVAYLTGEREFWSLPLRVSPDTLIPRPDTETLVEHALTKMAAPNGSALDLGTGTGAIALALASERSGWHFTGVDRIAAAVKLARYNADALQLTNVHFLISDWFSQLVQQRYQLIVSNPPYIDPDDPHLQEGDLRFEPTSALVAADHGLSDIRSIIEMAPDFLVAQGWLLIEHGCR